MDFFFKLNGIGVETSETHPMVFGANLIVIPLHLH